MQTVQPQAVRIGESTEKFRSNPGAGMTTPAVTATLVNGHARLSSGPFNWDSDLGPAVGGENLAPSPTAYLLGALAGCAVAFLRDTLAPQFSVTLSAIEATARCRADVAGLLGIEGTTPAIEEIELTVRVTSPDPGDRLDAMFVAWQERCPIYLALRNANPVRLDFQSSAG